MTKKEFNEEICRIYGAFMKSDNYTAPCFCGDNPLIKYIPDVTNEDVDKLKEFEKLLMGVK